MKLKKNKSDDEEDQQFLEKYSGTRRNAALNKETSEFKKIQEQISCLNDKFKSLEETTESLRSTILMQNNEIQNLMSELIHLYNNEDKRFKAIISEMAPSSQKAKALLEKQEQIPRIRPQNPAFLSNFDREDSPARINLQLKNQLQRELGLDLDNKFPRNSGNVGRLTHEFNREFAAPSKHVTFR